MTTPVGMKHVHGRHNEAAHLNTDGNNNYHYNSHAYCYYESDSNKEGAGANQGCDEKSTADVYPVRRRYLCHRY